MHTTGDKLSAKDQQHVLSAYVHRFTMEHTPAWAMNAIKGNCYYAPQYRSDAEWLANSTFVIKKNGSLDQRVHSCLSSGQTWPCGQWLDQPYRGNGTRSAA